MVKDPMIWAKFEHKQGIESLEEHIHHCLSVMRGLKEAYGDIPERCGNPRFFELLFYAVVLHDFGKAASGWQQSWVNGSRWGYRHEVLSAAFVDHLLYEECDRRAVTLAIYTHHKSLSKVNEMCCVLIPAKKSFGFEDTIDFTRKLQELDEHWTQLQDIWSKIPQLALTYLGYDPEMQVKSLDVRTLTNSYRKYLLAMDNDYTISDFRSSQMEWIFLRGMLETCDHIGSAHLDSILIHSYEWTYPKVVGKNSFQSRMTVLDGSCCLIAPTGSGKTEAALMWAQHNYRQVPQARLFYVLPYTASINAMYWRLRNITGASEDEVGILHGRAQEFLYDSLLSSDEERTQADIESKRLYRQSKELYAPYKILTPHQILMAFLGLRGFEKRLTELSDALVIVDEVHVYNPEMMARVLFVLATLIHTFQARVCLMSATFPTFLKKLVQEKLGISEDQVILPKAEELTQQRHRIQLLEGNWSAYQTQIEMDVRAGRRVLVICNTVRSAIRAFGTLREACPVDAVLLHSRFISRDRVHIERSKLKSAQLLVATQVVEVSLDISFDVLYSEPAPIDPLLQRLGRVNRLGINPSAPCFIFSEEWPKRSPVYQEQRTDSTLAVIRKVSQSGGVPMEKEWAAYLDEVYGTGYFTDEMNQFNMVYDSLEKSFRTMVAGKSNDAATKQFLKMIDAETVIPEQYASEYIQSLKYKDYRKARSYEISLPRSTFYHLKKSGMLVDYEGHSIAQAPYDDIYGLRTHDDEE